MAPPRPRDGSPTLHVTIVANNPETLDGLQEYFQRAGIDARGTRQIEGWKRTSPPCAAVVLFPDDFAFDEVKRTVGQLQRARPNILSILVSADPKRFEAVAGDAIVIPKPAWGWTILDTIRGRLP
jgi:hypothetical protein